MFGHITLLCPTDTTAQLVLPYERSGSFLPNAFGMYQVAFEMYPPETRAQLKFVVEGATLPPTRVCNVPP